MILLARTLVLERSASPMCATLRIACGEPYEIEVDGEVLKTRASLVAPGTRRDRVRAVDSRVVLFYMPVEVTRLLGIAGLIGERGAVNLDVNAFSHLFASMEAAARGELSPLQARALMDDVIRVLIADAPRQSVPMDARIRKVIDALKCLPLNEVESGLLCARVHLSASRLRTLFKAETGYTIQQYARWLAVWRACFLWRRGVSFTTVAAEVGFHDLSHVGHAFAEVFGISPIHLIDTRHVVLINCAHEQDGFWVNAFCSA